MIHRYIEFVISMALIVVLALVPSSSIIVAMIDVLPINKDLTLEEFLDKVVDKDNTYEYIQKSDYIFITEFSEDGSEDEYLAFKGKASGYINTYYDDRDRIDLWRDSHTVEGVDGTEVSYCFKKHRGKYLLEFCSYQKNVILYDNNNNKLDRMSRYFFDVLEDEQEDYEVYCKVDDKTFKVVDFNIIKSLVLDYEDKDFFDDYPIIDWSIRLGLAIFIYLLSFIYHKFIINLYVKKINEAIYAQDEEKEKALLRRVYKRQKGAVYNKICEELGISVDKDEQSET